jgi:hypothetical protein
MSKISDKEIVYGFSKREQQVEVRIGAIEAKIWFATRIIAECLPRSFS